MRDARVIALYQLDQRRTFGVGGISALHDRARRMFFRRVELSEARAKDARLPVIAARGDLLLLDAIFGNPHFRAVVVGSVADNDDL